MTTSMAQLDILMKTKERYKHGTGKMAITGDNTKVLGKITDMRTEKVRESQKFSTNKMKTHNSAWTPVINKASNEQIFMERRDLVSHWFDMWTDSQRKRFFDLIFRQCTRRQNKFIQDWFEERVPLQHLDFSTVLPRLLTLYVFSFLEPISMSRCAQVCWHWKFLAEQDVLWMPKCMKYGWFLPYTPSPYEFGSWKRHYIACVNTMDYVSADNSMYGMRGDGSHLTPKRPTKKEQRSLTLTESNTMLTGRPPWSGPDYRPKDLNQNMFAFLHDYNPNEPKMPKSALLFHNRWGVLKKKSNVTTNPGMELGLSTQKRRERHRALTSGEDYELSTKHNMTLSESMKYDVVNPREKRMTELVDTAWFPSMRTSARRPNMAGGSGEYTYSSTQKVNKAIMQTGSERQQNPRVIFISSRVPAADLLHDAVLFGVIPIVYEYEGTTPESLTMRLEQCLEGRHAQSVGLFCHTQEAGEIKLVHGCNISIKSLDYPEAREFFESIASHVLPTELGGQLDVFAPLAASEPGMELMVQLTVITGVQFSSPTGIIGNYNHVNSDWCIPYKDGSPPEKYFCSSKLNVWANTADQAVESAKQCKKILSPFFEKAHRDVASQLTGEMVFGVLGQTDIHGVKSITAAITEALSELGSRSEVNPLEFIGEYLLQKAGVNDLEFTSTHQKLQSGGEEEEDEEQEDEEEEEEANLDPMEETKRSRDIPRNTDWDGEDRYVDEDGEAKKDEGTEKGTLKMQRSHRSQKKQVILRTQELSQKFGTIRVTGKFEKLTTQRLRDFPEKRTPIAFELVTSELEFNRHLHAIKTVYFKPLTAALKSNRAIISNQNLQIIFTDVLQILQLSNELLENLQNRVLDWDAQHSCLGDIFVKFCTNLKVYTNFINNNEVILRCIERSKEQTPSFRAFLKRTDRTPETKMLTLQEMLLAPSTRINNYVSLLSWFELHTPKSHQDRADLADAINTLTELDTCINECKLRMGQDREIVELQKKIQNCPALLEANRYLIKHQDVCQLNPPKKSEIPELQVYQHAAMFGIFLFNDALVFTRRMSKHFPFSRAVEYVYKFEVSVSLQRMRILDISDSKVCKNGFSIKTPKQQWFFSMDTPEEKFNLVSILEQTVRAALQG